MDAISSQAVRHSPKPKKFRPPDVTDVDIISNDHADKFAVEAAKSAQVADTIANPYLYVVKTIALVQQRLIAIICSLPRRDKKDLLLRPPRCKPPTIDSLIEHTRHSIRTFGDRIVCWKCKNGYSKKDPAIRSWLVADCLMLSAATQRPTPIVDDESRLHIGNRCIHVTHDMRHYKGFIYCKKCGSRAGETRLNNLARACIPPKSGGIATLRAISQDRLPPGLHKWPIEAAPNRIRLG